MTESMTSSIISTSISFPDTIYSSGTVIGADGAEGAVRDGDDSWCWTPNVCQSVCQSRSRTGLFVGGLSCVIAPITLCENIPPGDDAAGGRAIAPVEIDREVPAPVGMIPEDEEEADDVAIEVGRTVEVAGILVNGSIGIRY
ncbi:hypothetical protein GCK72_008231 [Caenorhabditis remanei]|uniref:Uncharacterized protein n=1 Tax=Caenorhabditis remanei TaxID=31234 RepID=A0A6A5GZP3_CAERE|nr:hypothetical protein GCK72_008231 [Caenorhabditis remanei]KAF1759986.1 hypothetical protein GCK72_008231 [Caenorhabditis remanei]